MWKNRWRCSVALWLLSPAVLAIEFISVAGDKAILYDAPSRQAKKLGEISGPMPGELVVGVAGWVKVRTPYGQLCWLEASSVSKKRTVMAVKPLVDVRELPQFTSRVVFRVAQEVALDWLDNTGDGWVKVRHQDGATGYVRSEDVWGE